MKKAPTLWKLKDLVASTVTTTVEIDGKWIPARPIGLHSLSYRFKLAWMVFTGKADAVVWPGDQ